MNRLPNWSLLLVTGLALCVRTPQAAGDDFKLEAGFVPMFNGKDFSGWQFGKSYGLPEPQPKNWKVEDGVIKLSGGGSPHLGSQWDYDDFDMRFQWRAMREKYNSGFFIRSRRKVGNNQINLAKGGEGRFIGGKLKGSKPVPRLQKPAKEWNEWRVLVVGDKVKFWCNGQPAWEGTAFQTKRGHIGLQAEGAPLEFRRLRIKEIGWESLSDSRKWPKSKAGQWKNDGYGAVFSPVGVARARPEEIRNDYVLRLEWRSEKSRPARIGVINGTRMTVVRINDPDGVVIEGVKPGDTTDNPPGQWNYLQLTLDGGKLSVWQNGTDLVKSFDTTKGQLVDGGFLVLRASEGGVQFRNIRLRAVKH